VSPTVPATSPSVHDDVSILTSPATSSAVPWTRHADVISTFGAKEKKSHSGAPESVSEAVFDERFDKLGQNGESLGNLFIAQPPEGPKGAKMTRFLHRAFRKDPATV